MNSMNKNSNPLITIITVVLNGDKSIEKTIKSVVDQSYNNIEYIIIDGASTDKTINIIKQYEDKISFWISESDNGIWDAMNKSLKYANGEIIGFLNSDDVYYPDTVSIVNKYFTNNKIDFLFGTVEKYKLMHGYKPWKIKWSFGFYTSHSVGFFIKTNKHREVGLYNPKYLSADLNFFYKMINNFKMKGMASKKNEIFGKFTKGGFASKVNYIDHLIDLNKIRIDNHQNIIFVYFLFLIKILKKPLKFLRSVLKKYY